MEEWISSERPYRGTLVTLRKGRVRLDDGTEAFREVIEHPGGVGVVPFLGDSVMLIRQYRVAIGKEILEIPAGKLEPGDTPESRGRKELQEEAGLAAGRMVSVGSMYPSVGFLTETIHLFLALDLSETERSLEPDERIELVETGLDEIRAMLSHHRFEDAKTIIGLHALLGHLRNESEGI